MPSVLNFRSAPPPDLKDPFNEYRKIRFQTPAVSSDPRATAAISEYRLSGDHVFVHSINGPGVIQIRFSPNLPWITVQEGMTVSRDYKIVYVRDAGLYTGKNIPLTTALLYTSYGPMVHMPFKASGIRPTPYVGNVTLVANTIYTLEAAIALFLAPTDEGFAGDFTGASFLIRVSQDAAGGAQLQYGEIGTLVYAANSGYKMFPGEWVTIEQAGKMSRMSKITTAPATTRYAWHISPMTAATATTINFIIGYRADMSDPDYTGDAQVAGSIPNPLGME